MNPKELISMLDKTISSLKKEAIKGKIIHKSAKVEESEKSKNKSSPLKRMILHETLNSFDMLMNSVMV